MNEDLEETLIRILNDNRTIDNETHGKHHDYITSELNRRQRREEMAQKLKLSMIGTIGTALIGGMAWVGKLIFDAISRGTH